MQTIKIIKEIEMLKRIQHDPFRAQNDNEIKILLKGIKPGIYFLQFGNQTKKFLVIE
ncbi:MAG: hypothetical protein ABIK93_06385 [candidate division WOR-3 bacterium]